jgi:transketolase
LARNLPCFKALYPADGNQAVKIAEHIVRAEGNYLVFTGRNKMPIIDNGKGKPFFGKDYLFEEGRADWLREGKDGTIITYGNMAGKAIEAKRRLLKEGLDYGVLCFSTLSPARLLDRDALQKAAETGRIVSLEDHLVGTGLGNMIADELMCGDYQFDRRRFQMMKIGITQPGRSGKPEELYLRQGLDGESLLEKIKDWH